MKIEIIYHEIKKKEFRSEKTLRKFLDKKLPSEVLRVVETVKGINYMVEIMGFLHKYREKRNEL